MDGGAVQVQIGMSRIRNDGRPETPSQRMELRNPENTSAAPLSLRSWWELKPGANRAFCSVEFGLLVRTDSNAMVKGFLVSNLVEGGYPAEDWPIRGKGADDKRVGLGPSANSLTVMRSLLRMISFTTECGVLGSHFLLAG